MIGARKGVVVVLLGLAGVLVSAAVGARESMGSPAARAFYEQGDAAVGAAKLSEAVAAFRKAIDADPDFVDAHQRFIEVTQRQEQPGSRTPAVQRLVQIYEGWARLYPRRAAYEWALGFLTPDADKADEYFRKALAIDPSFARAHFLLARNADQRGDWASQRRHLQLAVESNREEPRYLLRYATAHRKNDPARFRELALQVVDKFPTSPSAAEALWNLAGEASNPERRAYFDRLRANYPAARFGYSAAAMTDLYGELTNPAEALALAREMAVALPANRAWPQRVAVQEALTRAQALIAGAKFAEALEVLSAVQRPSGTHGTTLILLKAEAAARAGRGADAYATLVESAAASPDPRVDAALQKQAADLGKTRQEVEADLWRLRDAKATVAAPFALPSSTDGAPVQLSDFRGRLVLIAFWFPG
jgi:tetratricopeptide (TPR) repeat protein